MWNEIGENPPVENYEESQRPTNNPSWWPTDHRRIPDHRPARVHPEWHELTGNSPIVDIVVMVLFGGCHLIAVGSAQKPERHFLTDRLKLSDWLPRRLGINRIYIDKRIAGEW